MTEQPIPYVSDDEKVYFAVTVTKRRADYLYECLHTPLCDQCGRELAECEADPCKKAKSAQRDSQGWTRYRPPKI